MRRNEEQQEMLFDEDSTEVGMRQDDEQQHTLFRKDSALDDTKFVQNGKQRLAAEENKNNNRTSRQSNAELGLRNYLDTLGSPLRLDNRSCSQVCWDHLKSVDWKKQLKWVNGGYAVWASSVFALLSFFRANGREDFNDLEANKIALGVFYAVCSLTVNVPMAYLFSYKAVSSVKRFLANKDCYFRTSFFLGTALGVLTTASGVAVAKIGLDKWAFQWIASPTTAVFAWNTLTTRSISTTNLIYSFLTWIAERVMYYWPTDRYKNCKSYIKLIDDIDRHGAAIPKVEGNAGNYSACFVNFYRQLTVKNLNAKYSWSDYLGWVTKTLSSVFLFVLAIDTLALWLGLAEKGLNTVSDFFGDGHWGNQMPWLTWLTSLSSWCFYLESARNAPNAVRKVYNQPAMARYKNPVARWMVTLVAIAPFLTLGWFSGAGYSETATELTRSGFGEVADAVMPLHQWMQSLLGGGYTSWYFFLMSGLLVNGFSAVEGFFKHAPHWLESRCACLFEAEALENANPEGRMSSGDLSDWAKRKVFIHDLDRSVSEMLCDSRSGWERSNRNLYREGSDLEQPLMDGSQKDNDAVRL